MMLVGSFPPSVTAVIAPFLCLLVLVQQSQKVEAWADYMDYVTCPEPGSNHCVGTAELYGPSPILPTCDYDDPDCDGSFVYSGGWHWSYAYVMGLAEGTSTSTLSEDEKNIYFTGENMRASVEDDRTTCSVFANDLECCSCEICEFVEWGVSTLSADCTNVANGRRMVCEPLEMGVVARPPLFYPFGDVDHDGGTCPGTEPNLPPSSAPTTGSSAPTRSPTESPIVSTRIPTTAPTESPVVNKPPTVAPTLASRIAL